MALVQVKPIEKPTWHGLSGIKRFTAPKVIEALVSINTGKYATGLTEEDRERLEKATGFDLSPVYIPGKIHPFWGDKISRVTLEHRTNLFDTSNPLDEIKVKILKASDLVANSQKEYEEGLFPYAQFVIFDEAEEVERKASKLALRNQAIVELNKLTQDKKAELVQILLGLPVRKQSLEYIDLKLNEALESEGAEKVLFLIKRNKKETFLHALILEAIHKNILKREASGIYYMEESLGFDENDAIAYLLDSKNQALQAQLLDKINS